MIRKIFVAAALLLVMDTAAALRVIEQVERAVELTLGDLILPPSGGTTVSFPECFGCSLSTHRLSDSTVYVANGRIVTLAEFLSIAAEIAAKPNGKSTAVAAVYLDIKTGRLTRIQLRE
jgi:hypothetical protein